jgi:hypothetical protein
MNSKFSEIGLLVMITILILVALVLGPWVTIWALNTLFPLLAIPFNLATWFAVIWIGAFFKTTFKYK